MTSLLDSWQRQLRHRLDGTSTAQIARRVGLNPGTVSSHLNGESIPSLDTIEAYCSKLGWEAELVIRDRSHTLYRKDLIPPQDRSEAVLGPGDAAAVFRDLFDGEVDQERFYAAYVDQRHRLLCPPVLISLGTLGMSIVHPRDVFRHAVAISAAAIILAHNHPSGDPRPSNEDLDLTKRMAEAGTLMGIEIIDHIILGTPDWVSLREAGWPVDPE